MEALTFYRAELRKSPVAIDYLKGRGLTGEIAARYGLGYAPDQWQALQGVFADYDAQELRDAGLVIDAEPTESAGAEPARKGRRYDRFRGRIMFPILDARGNVLGFGGRVLGEGQPKYLNSPETPVFEKGRELYGLYQAKRAIRDSNRVIVVEGYMDVVALAQHGVANVVATLGTATTPVHVTKLLKLADDVVFCFDGDAAGRKAAWRALEVSLPALSDGKSVSFLFLPSEDDPDSYVRRVGKEGFEAALAQATPLSQVLLGELASGVDLNSEEGRARLLAQARPLVAQIVAPAMSALIRRRLTELTGVEIGALPGFEAPAPAPTGRRPGSATPPRATRRPPPVERQLLARILRHPSLAVAVDPTLVGRDSADGEVLLEVIQWVRSLGGGSPTLGQLTAHFEGSALSAAIEAALQEGLLDQLGEGEVDLEAEVAALAGRLSLGRAELRKAALESAALSRGLTDAERAEWAQLQARQAAAKGVGPPAGTRPEE